MTLSLGKAFPFEMALGTYPLGIWGSSGKALIHILGRVKKLFDVLHLLEE